MATPCSVKAYGRDRRPPQLEVTDCDLKLANSSRVSWNMRCDAVKLREIRIQHDPLATQRQDPGLNRLASVVGVPPFIGGFLRDNGLLLDDSPTRHNAGPPKRIGASFAQGSFKVIGFRGHQIPRTPYGTPRAPTCFRLPTASRPEPSARPVRRPTLLDLEPDGSPRLFRWTHQSAERRKVPDTLTRATSWKIKVAVSDSPTYAGCS